MGELLTREGNCTICGGKAIFEYMWANLDPAFCLRCATMVARNVGKDVLRHDKDFLKELQQE